MLHNINDPHRRLKQGRRLIAAALAALILSILVPAFSQRPAQTPTFKPQVPTAPRNSSHVILERAGTLYKQSTDSFMILIDTVVFSKGGMMMYCDSAHYFPESESFDAFGNVRMEQGDTLFVYADSLIYRSDDQLARLYGEPVVMINRDVELRTDEFVYDLYSEFGYYEVGGTLFDKQNKLTSVQGEYVPSTKESNFYLNVRLASPTNSGDTMYIYTDTLYYNTDSHIAEIHSWSEIINTSDTIFTTYGVYDTNTEKAELYDRSLVRMGRGTTLIGDTLFYDKQLGYGWARGNMELIDSVRQSTLSGDYGYYDQTIDSAYVTGRARAMEYSRGDTLYMHGREIFSFAVYDTIFHPEDTVNMIKAYAEIDTTHVLIAHPRVRFYRSDMQGVCDSLRFEEADSTLYMFRHPIVWSGERQIFGNVIQLHLNDSTIDRAELPDFGFSAELVEENFFNQLSGKEMIAYFDGNEMKKLDVNGNVEAIMLPMENDSTYNKIINTESSYMIAEFEKQNLLRMKMWPETSGTVTPLYLAKKNLFFLSGFKWYTGIRPEFPDDIFNIPPEMEELMGVPTDPGTAKRAKPKRSRAAQADDEARAAAIAALQGNTPEGEKVDAEPAIDTPEATEPAAEEPQAVEPSADEPEAVAPEEPEGDEPIEEENQILSSPNQITTD